MTKSFVGPQSSWENTRRRQNVWTEVVAHRPHTSVEREFVYEPSPAKNSDKSPSLNNFLNIK